MPVDFPPGDTDAVLGLGEHVHDLVHRLAAGAADTADRVEANETDHQVADVVDQRRVRDAEARFEDVLAEPREEPGEIDVVRADHVAAP